MPLIPFHLELTDRAPIEVRDALARQLIAFNEGLLGPSGTRPLAVLIRDADGGLLGGLWGRTGFGWLFVELLVVPDELRGQGVGTRLLATAEDEAAARGCGGAWLDTLNPAAYRFYRRHGYERFGALPDYPAGNPRSFLVKRFAGSGDEPRASTR